MTVILPPLFTRLPSHLQDDVATLNRFRNLHEAADQFGTRGTYVGWIAREVVRRAEDRNDLGSLRSSLEFFQSGGPLRDLEERLGVSGGVLRRVRASRVAASGAPLASLKAAEMGDMHFRLSHDPAEFRQGQATAYLADARTSELMARVQAEAPALLEPKAAARRYREARRVLEGIAVRKPLGEGFWRTEVLAAFQHLGDPISRRIAERAGRAYALHVLPSEDFAAKVAARHFREGRRHFPDPKIQNAVFFRPGDPELYVRSRPLDLAWNLRPADVLFQVGAIVVQEDRHAGDLEAEAPAWTEEAHFAMELRGHAEEFLFRAFHGDVGPLTRMTRGSFLGFALAFRDVYERLYRPV